MYLHLGGDILINKDKVIAIIDLETVTIGGITHKFLSNIKDNKIVHNISEPGKEKTLIITTKRHYLSPISSTTLFKRSFSDVGKE
jgi:hypothetical protein